MNFEMEEFAPTTILPPEEEQPPIIYTGLDAFIDIIIFLMILTCALIIFTISINKRLQTRTYWILLNWSANEILFLVFAALREVLDQFLNGCLKINLGLLFLVICTTLMFIIVSSFVINTNHSLKIILGLMYISIILIYTGLYVLCTMQSLILPSIGVFLLSFLVLLITVLVKECNKCIKMKSTPLREKTVFRLNLARIYIYNCVLISVLYIVFSKDVLDNAFVRQFAMASFMLAPVYIILYAMAADKNFKIAVRNVFRKTGDREVLDAEDNLTDDDYVAPVNV